MPTIEQWLMRRAFVGTNPENAANFYMAVIDVPAMDGSKFTLRIGP